MIYSPVVRYAVGRTSYLSCGAKATRSWVYSRQPPAIVDGSTFLSVGLNRSFSIYHTVRWTRYKSRWTAFSWSLILSRVSIR